MPSDSSSSSNTPPSSSTSRTSTTTNPSTSSSPTKRKRIPQPLPSIGYTARPHPTSPPCAFANTPYGRSVMCTQSPSSSASASATSDGACTDALPPSLKPGRRHPDPQRAGLFAEAWLSDADAAAHADDEESESESPVSPLTAAETQFLGENPSWREHQVSPVDAPRSREQMAPWWTGGVEAVQGRVELAAHRRANEIVARPPARPVRVDEPRRGWLGLEMFEEVRWRVRQVGRFGGMGKGKDGRWLG